MSGSIDIDMAIVIAITCLLIGLVNWRARQPPVKRRGVFIVSHPLPIRICALGGLLAFLWGLSPAFGIGSESMTFRDAAILFALTAPFIAAFGFATLYYWRSRIEYDEASLTSYSALGSPRRVALADITGIGNSGVRGQEFVINTGGKIYVSPHQRGGQTLITLLQTQVSTNKAHRNVEENYVSESTSTGIPIWILAVEIASAVFLFTGFFAYFDQIEYLPEKYRFDNYAIVFMVMGVVLSVPLLLHLYGRSRKARGPDKNN